MSSIIHLAKIQKTRFEIAARAEGCISSDLHSAKFKWRCQRVARRNVSVALKLEQEMIERALKRPEDFEEYGNYDLVGAIANLTKSRINRLAYAGRVLP